VAWEGVNVMMTILSRNLWSNFWEKVTLSIYITFAINDALKKLLGVDSAYGILEKLVSNVGACHVPI
jgi:hypothetical protein